MISKKNETILLPYNIEISKLKQTNDLQTSNIETICVIGTTIGISLYRFRLSSRGQHTSPTTCI